MTDRAADMIRNVLRAPDRGRPGAFPVIRLDLYGSTVARFATGDRVQKVEASAGGTICASARAMLALGVDPDEKVDVRRDGLPVFDRLWSVCKWASLTVSEDSERGPRFRRYREAETHSSGNSSSASVVGRSEEEPPHSWPEAPEGA